MKSLRIYNLLLALIVLIMAGNVLAEQRGTASGSVTATNHAYRMISINDAPYHYDTGVKVSSGGREISVGNIRPGMSITGDYVVSSGNKRVLTRIWINDPANAR